MFFFKRFQARGYMSDHIKPLFNKAIARAQHYSGPTDRATNDENMVILHLVCVCVCLVCLVCVLSVCA